MRRYVVETMLVLPLLIMDMTLLNLHSRHGVRSRSSFSYSLRLRIILRSYLRVVLSRMRLLGQKNFSRFFLVMLMSIVFMVYSFVQEECDLEPSVCWSCSSTPVRNGICGPPGSTQAPQHSYTQELSSTDPLTRT